MKAILVSLLLLGVLIFGCVSSSDKPKSISDCELKDYETLVMGDYAISLECLYSKASTVEACKGYNSTLIFDSINPFTGERNKIYYDENIADLCVESLAIRTNNTMLCNQLSNNLTVVGELLLKDRCFSTLAIKTNNILLCDEIIGNQTTSNGFAMKIGKMLVRDSCILSVAVNKKEPQLCTRATNASKCFLPYLYKFEIEEECGQAFPNFNFARLACVLNRLNVDDHSSCTNVYNGNECWAILGVLKNSTELCDNSVTIGERNFRVGCYYDLAAQGVVGLSSCDQLGIDFMSCYEQVAIYSKNASICYSLSNYSGRTCVYNVAQKALNPRICNEMNNFIVPEASVTQLESCRANILNKLTPANYTAELCEFIGDACWYELAIRNRDQVLCRNINSAASKQECELRVSRS